MGESGIAGTWISAHPGCQFDQELMVTWLVWESVQARNYREPIEKKALHAAFSVLGPQALFSTDNRPATLWNSARRTKRALGSHLPRTKKSVNHGTKTDTICSSDSDGEGRAMLNCRGSSRATSNPFWGHRLGIRTRRYFRYSQVDYDRTRIGSTVTARQYAN